MRMVRRNGSVCDCGNTTIVLGKLLRRGDTRTCGWCNISGHQLIDLTGQRFGRLLVRYRAPGDAWGKARWACTCDCGNDHLTDGDCLRSGTAQSCGCLKLERGIEANTTHGMAPAHGPAPEYNAWRNMLRRCENSNNPSYENYGGRGISVHPDWREFAAFYVDVGPRPGPGYWLKPKDTSADYGPDNCAWELPARQRKRWSGRKVAKKREREHLRDLLKTNR
jgi:hypothetical protein